MFLDSRPDLLLFFAVFGIFPHLVVSIFFLPIDNMINEATSFADSLECGPLKIISQCILKFANSKSDASKFISGVLDAGVTVFTR